MVKEFDQDFISQEMREALEEPARPHFWKIIFCSLAVLAFTGFVVHDIWFLYWQRATFFLLIIYGFLALLHFLLSTERTPE